VRDLIRTFVRWNTARRREALAAKWDATADHLLGRKIEVKAEAAAYTRSEGRTPVSEALWRMAGWYSDAERGARIMAAQVRAGR